MYERLSNNLLSNNLLSNKPSNSLTVIAESLKMYTLFLTYSEPKKIEDALSKELRYVGSRVIIKDEVQQYYKDIPEKTVGKITRLIYKSFVEVNFPTTNGVHVLIFNISNLDPAPSLTIELQGKELIAFKEAHEAEQIVIAKNQSNGTLYEKPEIGSRVHWKRGQDVGRVSKITKNGTDPNLEIEVTFPMKNGTKIFTYLMSSLVKEIKKPDKTEIDLWKVANKNDEEHMREIFETYDERYSAPIVATSIFSLFSQQPKTTPNPFFKYTINTKLSLMKEKYENDINVIKKDPTKIRDELIIQEIEENYKLQRLNNSLTDKENLLFETDIIVKELQMKLIVINNIIKDQTINKITKEKEEYFKQLNDEILLKEQRLEKVTKDIASYDNNIPIYKEIRLLIKNKLSELTNPSVQLKENKDFKRDNTAQIKLIKKRQSEYNALSENDSQKKTKLDTLHKLKVEYEEFIKNNLMKNKQIYENAKQIENVKTRFTEYNTKFIDSIKAKEKLELSKLEETIKEIPDNEYNNFIDLIIDFISEKQKNININKEQFTSENLTITSFLDGIKSIFKDKKKSELKTEIIEQNFLKLSEFLFKYTEIQHDTCITLLEDDTLEFDTLQKTKAELLKYKLMLLYEKEFQLYHKLKTIDDLQTDTNIEYLKLYFETIFKYKSKISDIEATSRELETKMIEYDGLPTIIKQKELHNTITESAETLNQLKEDVFTDTKYIMDILTGVKANNPLIIVRKSALESVATKHKQERPNFEIEAAKGVIQRGILIQPYVTQATTYLQEIQAWQLNTKTDPILRGGAILKQAEMSKYENKIREEVENKIAEATRFVEAAQNYEAQAKTVLTEQNLINFINAVFDNDKNISIQMAILDECNKIINPKLVSIKQKKTQILKTEQIIEVAKRDLDVETNTEPAKQAEKDKEDIKTKLQSDTTEYTKLGTILAIDDINAFDELQQKINKTMDQHVKIKYRSAKESESNNSGSNSGSNSESNNSESNNSESNNSGNEESKSGLISRLKTKNITARKFGSVGLRKTFRTPSKKGPAPPRGRQFVEQAGVPQPGVPGSTL
jgi:hypothetical protein